MLFLKITNSILILAAVSLGLKQGYAMVSGKPEITEMFAPWGFGKLGLAVNGAVTMLAALLIPFPKTFLSGNFLMAAAILLILCLNLLHKDLEGALVESPFLLLNLVIIYLQHPLEMGTTIP